MRTGTFSLGFNDGGPVMVWSNWVLTAVMNLAVALSLAEISSAMPVVGGPYHWCALRPMKAAVSQHARARKCMHACRSYGHLLGGSAQALCMCLSGLGQHGQHLVQCTCHQSHQPLFRLI